MGPKFKPNRSLDVCINRLFRCFFLFSLIVCVVILVKAGPIAAATFNVEVGPGGSFVFSPDTVNINTGDTVTWTFMTGGHSTTSGTSCAYNGPGPNTWNSGILNSGATFDFTFNTPGTFPYFCIPHCTFGMVGTVNVSGAAPTINISVTPASVSFGNVNVGSTSDQTVTITNQATSDATLTGNVGTLAAPFSVQSGGGAFSLTPGQSTTVTVRFSPTVAGAASGTLSITHNATNQASPTTVSLSGAGGKSTLTDYDGDGATDVAAFHLPTDQFFTDYAGNLGQFGWGESDSMPLIWDYDGDGKTDVSIYHIPTNQWFVQGVGNLGQFGWGGEESVPVPGDYNGDGRMERAFYHSPTNRWFVEGQDSVQFGWNGAECIPVPGDYDGDGKTDMVIYHIPSNQWFQYGVGNLGQFGWGGEDCIPVPGDYNGDGKTEIAVYHVPTNQWFVKGMGNLGQYGWGGLESFPIPGDYNGDGVMERGFYRPSENRWFIEGESDFVWGWGGSEFMPITSQIAVYNWFRFNLHKFE
jgi:plastocyanin